MPVMYWDETGVLVDFQYASAMYAIFCGAARSAHNVTASGVNSPPAHLMIP
jgi:hypothetical protein